MYQIISPLSLSEYLITAAATSQWRSWLLRLRHGSVLEASHLICILLFNCDAKTGASMVPDPRRSHGPWPKVKAYPRRKLNLHGALALNNSITEEMRSLEQFVSLFYRCKIASRIDVQGQSTIWGPRWYLPAVTATATDDFYPSVFATQWDLVASVSSHIYLCNGVIVSPSVVSSFPSGVVRRRLRMGKRFSLF